MKKTLARFTTIVLIGFAILSGMTFSLANLAHAEESENAEEESTQELKDGTSISISPVSRIFQLNPSSTYEDVLKVSNDSKDQINFEVYAAPYSYMQSEETGDYTLGFNNENNYTQITRWIKIKDKDGNYVSRPTFLAQPGETIEISYQINTPESMPAGGQYAVLFAHTLSNAFNVSGIKTEASPGMIIYGRSSGETIVASEINNMSINRTITKEISAEENGQTVRKNTVIEHINASAKVKNTGNLDFNAKGVLKIEGILGGAYYETPENEARVSIIPETELTLSDEWEETPSFGLYKATWTVTAGEETRTEELIVFLMPPSAIIIAIILLTIIIVWIIMGIRKRKERRSRLAV